MYNNITNLLTNKKIIITSSLGKSLSDNSINYIEEAGITQSKKINIKALWEWEKDELDDLKDIIKNPGETILPPKLKIDNPSNLKGIYTYMGEGGGGAIYVCETKSLAVKVVFSSSTGLKESQLQIKAKNIAPKIHIHIELDKLDNQHILLDEDMLEYCEDTVDVNEKMQKLSVYIIVMDYLDMPDWTPLSKVKNINSKSIFTLLQNLVYQKSIYNIIDLVGYTGDHIFYNKKTNTYKIIDYGAFMEVKKTDDKEKLVETMWENINKKLRILDLK
jgi:hypothetical protein